jgi:hypothetical protein
VSGRPVARSRLQLSRRTPSPPRTGAGRGSV